MAVQQDHGGLQDMAGQHGQQRGHGGGQQRLPPGAKDL